MTDEWDLARHAFERVHLTRLETIAGITIDLRHKDLPEDEWSTLPLTKGWPAAYFIFPWTDRDHAEKRRSLRQVSVDTPPKPIEVKAGDRIEVGRVEWVKTGDGLDPTDDREVREALLTVVQSGTNRIDWPLSIRFARHASLWAADGTLRDTFDLIQHRLCNQLGLEKISDYKLGERDPTSAEQILISVQNLMPKVASLNEMLPEGREREQFRYTVDDLVALGYFWAKFEANLNARSLLQKAINSEAGARKGGLKSGELRRINAETTWQPHALDLARELRNSKPRISQDDIVQEIRECWKLVAQPPGSRNLKAFISKMEKSGELVRRQK